MTWNIFNMVKVTKSECSKTRFSDSKPRQKLISTGSQWRGETKTAFLLSFKIETRPRLFFLISMARSGIDFFRPESWYPDKTKTLLLICLNVEMRPTLFLSLNIETRQRLLLLNFSHIEKYYIVLGREGQERWHFWACNSCQGDIGRVNICFS